ncbi:MAG: glycosyltransferase family 2 protein, partial [Nitrospiraceae bacterium]
MSIQTGSHDAEGSGMTGQIETGTGKTPIVSVIVPTYNSGELLREALDSILAQTYKPIEIIVVDDGSTDQTREIVRAAGAPIHYFYQHNSGGCASPRNHGLRVASGAFLSVFDADDVMHPAKIERQVRFLQEHPDVGMVFSDYVNFSAAGRSPLSHFKTCPKLETLLGRTRGRRELVLEPKGAARIMALENFTIASSPMFRREVYAQVAGYDENLNASADFDFHYRVATRFNTGVLDEIGFYRRLHDANMTGNLPKSLRDVIASRTMLLRRETDRVARQSLRRKIADSYVALGYHCIGHDNAAALMHTVRSSLYRHPVHYGWVRNMAKICLSVVGMGKSEGPALAPGRGRGIRSRPIKIMYLIDQLDGARGGTESQLLQLLRRLDTGTFE